MLGCPTNRAHIKLKKYKKREHICSKSVIMELSRNQKNGGTRYALLQLY